MQGTVALWSNAPALDWKIEGSNLAANFSFERMTMTREKRGDEFGNEESKQGAPAKRTTIDSWNERAWKNEKRLDPKILSVNEED